MAEKRIEIHEKDLNMIIDITPEGDPRLLHFSALPFDPRSLEWGLHPDPSAFRLVEVQAAGENQDDHPGSKHTNTSPGRGLRYREHHERQSVTGRKLEIALRMHSTPHPGA